MNENKQNDRANSCRAAQLITRAEAVFGNTETARRWLSKPKKQLNGQSPSEAIITEHGAKLVDQLLEQIDSGYF